MVKAVDLEGYVLKYPSLQVYFFLICQTFNCSLCLITNCFSYGTRRAYGLAWGILLCDRPLYFLIYDKCMTYQNFRGRKYLAYKKYVFVYGI